MTSTSLSKEEKLNALVAAKLDYERDLYKTIAKLGYDPDTYNLDNFEFEEIDALEEQHEDYRLEQHLDMLLQRLTKISAKIAEL
jgi:hypothetical protein